MALEKLVETREYMMVNGDGIVCTTSKSLKRIRGFIRMRRKFDEKYEFRHAILKKEKGEITFIEPEFKDDKTDYLLAYKNSHMGDFE